MHTSNPARLYALVIGSVSVSSTSSWPRGGSPSATVRSSSTSCRSTAKTTCCTC